MVNCFIATSRNTTTLFMLKAFRSTKDILIVDVLTNTPLPMWVSGLQFFLPKITDLHFNPHSHLEFDTNSPISPKWVM